MGLQYCVEGGQATSSSALKRAKCDQLGLSPIHEEVASKTMPKCSESRDSGTVDDSYSADDDFDSPQKGIVGEYASSQDRYQSIDKAAVDADFDSPQEEAVGEFRDQSLDNKGALQSAEQKSAKLHRYSLERLSQLSKPVKHRAYHSDNGIDSKTAHKPKKTSLDSSECGSSFLERMATKEEERREKLQRAVARAIYDAKVDKNVCPNCGTVQSFEKLIQGKTECNNDGCKNEKHQYGPPRKFKLESFQERMTKSAQRRSLILGRIQEERERKLLPFTSHKTSRRKEELRKMASMEDFNTRMANDIRERKEKLASLEQAARALLEKEHRYKPTLNVAEHLIKNRKGGLERLAQPLRRYTEEYQPPDDEIEQMKKKKRIWKRPLESQPTKALDENKLKEKFQKMIM
ncbi:hypothetical protein ACHAW5_000287 [Stephanodiscus triporus]|uniref:Uncharacterized protein n=1 Tax=Stephanodiscus triporus TaxID=2934178 RepID=A0ABD3NFN8_9STRA